MVFLNMHPVNRPEVMIREASERFDASGRLTDERSRKQIGELTAELVAWTRRLARPSSTPPCRA
jgi:chromate reductase, NAD(P)H dehydrogenase (quinone)